MKSTSVITLIILSLLVRGAAASTIVGSGNPPNVPLQLVGVRAADEGSAFILVLGANGQVTNLSTNFTQMNPPPGLSNVIAISVDDFGALALTSEGAVIGWGDDSPPPAPTNIVNAVAISAGFYADLALQSNGTVVSWGNSTSVPTGLSNVVAISAGGGSYALEANGTVVAWGESSSPTLAGLDVIAISTGVFGDAAALLANGEVIGWDSSGPFSLLPASVTNTVAISGSPEALVALQANGTIVTAGTYVQSFSPAVSNVYSLGDYTYEWTVAVEGDGWPVVTVQPGNQTTGTGGTIYLHARAVASQSISYQWRLNGTNIPGTTTGDLIITNATGSNAGEYQAQVTSGFGFASSSVATVTVSPPSPQMPTVLTAH